MPGRKPYDGPYPASFAIAAVFALVIGFLVTAFVVSDRVAGYVPPAARVHFASTSHADPLWAFSVLLREELRCNVSVGHPTNCTPDARRALLPLNIILAFGAGGSSAAAFALFLAGDIRRSARRRRRPRLPGRRDPFRLYVGKATGILSELGHGAAIAPGAPVYLIGDDASQNVLFLGGIGTGKTSSGINRFVRQTLAQDAGVLAFDVKGDYGKTFRRIAAEEERRVVTIGVGGEPIDLLAGLTPEMASSFLKSVLILNGGGDRAASVYLNTSVDFARNAFTVLERIPGRYTLRDLYRVVFLPGELNAACEEAGAFVRDPEDLARVQTNIKWLTKIFPRFQDRIKDGTRTTLSQILDGFRHDEIDRAFCRGGDLRMEHVLDGQVYLLDLPIARYGMTAKTIYTMVKLRLFNVVDRRRTEPTWNQDRPVVFVCDEYQEIIALATDAMSDLNFWDKSRSARMVGIVSAQGWSSIRAVTGDDALTKAVLQNFRNKVAFQTEDDATIDYFVNLFGEVEAQRTDAARSTGMAANAAMTSSRAQRTSTRREGVIDAQLFRSELRRGRALCALSIGGKAHDDVLSVPHDG